MLDHLIRIARLAGRTVLRAVLASTVLFFLAVGVGPRTGTYRTATVLTGSMRPEMPPGSLVVLVPVDASTIKVGDVITFEAPVPGHPVVTHRIVRIVEPGEHPVVQTKGDANASRDPWDARISSSPVWRRVAVVPMAGTLINELRSPLLHQLTVYAVPALLFLAWLSSIWSRKPAAEDSACAV
jgi:signal peptidase